MRRVQPSLHRVRRRGLSEDDVDDLTKCIRTCLDCADICATTSPALSRQTGYDPILTKAALEACVTACKASGEECARHAEHHLHCRICAEVCRRCEQACRDLVGIGQSDIANGVRNGRCARGRVRRLSDSVWTVGHGPRLRCDSVVRQILDHRRLPNTPTNGRRAC